MNASTTTAAIAMSRRRLDLGIALVATSSPPEERPSLSSGLSFPGRDASVREQVGQGVPERPHGHERKVARHVLRVAIVLACRHEEELRPGLPGRGDLVLHAPDRL